VDRFDLPRAALESVTAVVENHPRSRIGPAPSATASRLLARETPQNAQPLLASLFGKQTKTACPTCVKSETRLPPDTRIRREVVGQMFDYAANAILHWPAEELRGRLEIRCAKAGKDPAAVLADELGVEPDGDDF
jgi:uncharacterized ParB-like nuclease family protein